MKKNLFLLAFVIQLIMIFSLSVYARTENDIISINEINFNSEILVKKVNDVYYLPLRPVMESLGWNLSWDNENKIITGNKDDNTIMIKIQNGEVILNGKTIISYDPVIIEDTTYLSVKFIVEEFGKKVRWDKERNSIVISDRTSGYVNVNGQGNVIVVGNNMLINIFEPYEIDTIYDMIEDADLLLNINLPDEALIKYKNVLDNICIEDTPEIYIHVMNNIGNAYSLKSQAEDKIHNIINAESYYKEALKAFEDGETSQRKYIIISNLANARLTLAEVTGFKKYIHEGINGYIEVTKGLKFKPCTLDSGLIFYNLAKAYHLLGNNFASNMFLLGAEKICYKTIEGYCLNRDSTHYAIIMKTLGNIYELLCITNNNIVYYGKSRLSYEKALKIWTLESFPLNYASVQKSLGDLHQNVNYLSNEVAQRELLKSLIYYEEALKINTLKKYPFNYVEIRCQQGNTYMKLFEKTQNSEYIESAKECYQDAIKIYTERDYPTDYNKINEKLKFVDEI